MITRESIEVKVNYPIYKEFPLNLEFPLFAGLLLGTAVTGLLFLGTTAEIDRLQQEDSTKKDAQKSRSPSEFLKAGKNSTPSNSQKIEDNPQINFYDWDNLANEAVGILIAGNSGSAKTSLAVWAMGKLTQKRAAQVIALDPHANRNKLWGELEIATVSDFSLIEKQLELLENLLDNRRNQPDNGDTVIIVADELGACIKNFQDSGRVQRTLERLGSEGRKYGILLISINTSSNCDDIGISAQNRNNFVTILCGASARDFAERKWKQTDKRQHWVISSAYPAVITGAVPHVIALHPTHGHYERFEITGMVPKGILPVNQISLTIPLATDEDKPNISSEAKRLLDWFTKKTDANNKAFGVRSIQQSRPFGKNSSHKLQLLEPVINELMQVELLEKNEDENYQLTSNQ